MPGPLSHLTLANVASLSLELPKGLADILERRLPFALAGANAPDFPYLAAAHHWGNAMHYDEARRIFAPALDCLRAEKVSLECWEKRIAFVCGILSHMVADVTIHPAVNGIAGPYDQSPENAARHQLIESYQDAFIFAKRMGVGDATVAEYVQNVITSAGNGFGGLDADVSSLFRRILTRAFPDLGTPTPDSWFFADCLAINFGAEEGENPLVAFLASKFDRGQLVLVPSNKVNHDYIDSIAAPPFGQISYETLFDHAVDNTIRTWTLFWEALEKNTELPDLFCKRWNLDSGKDESGSHLFQGGQQ